MQLAAQLGPFLLLALAGGEPAARPRLPLRAGGGRAPPSPDHPRLNLGLLVGGALCRRRGRDGVALRAPDGLDWRPIAARRARRACAPATGPLYNHYDEGGYLIWFVPEKPVFIDSRQDPYPLPFMLEHVAVERGQAALPPAVRALGIRCAFLPVESPTVAALDRDGWTTRYRDEKWTVLAGAP